MTSEEQKKILKMVEDGKISAEEALKLIQAMESPAIEGDVIVPPSIAFGSGPGMENPDPREFEEIASKAHRLWQILLGIGVSVVVLTAYWLYVLVSTSNYGFWFYCALFPFLFAVLLLALFSGSRTSHWLYVNVEQPHVDWPRNLTLGFPLPLGLAGWFLRNFGHNIEGLDQAATEEILKFMDTGFSSKEPLIVNVDQGHGGERVHVYIG